MEVCHGATQSDAGSTCNSLSLCAYAGDPPAPNDEGPFIGGVFSRPVGPPLVLLPKLEEFEPPPLFDAAGDSNGVIVMLDFNDSTLNTLLSGKSKPGNQAETEQAVLEAINAKGAATAAFFAQPNRARYLIQQDNRLDPKARALLSADHPDERLHRYLVLSYPTVQAALAAESYIGKQQGVLLAEVDKRLDFSWAPNDPYFPINTSSAGRYQWGMHAMNFPLAWDRSKGHGYVAAVDSGLYNGAPPADLAANYRSQFSFISSNPNPIYQTVEFHGTHVLGIIGATANNGIGVAGGCPTCSVAMARFSGATSDSAAAIYGLVDRGMQVVNLSFGSSSNANCTTMAPVCNAIASADSKQVLLVAAAGNFNQTIPQFPANQPSVLSVSGVQNTNPSSPGSWAMWYYDSANGSNYAGLSGVVAPAKSIVSTVPANWTYNSAPQYLCSDASGIDQSGIPGDGFGSCTGTSMAAPHVAALAGILRSVNPRLSRDSIKDVIRLSGSHYYFSNSQWGSGLPNARSAVDQAIAQTPNRLAPLFSMYSYGRLDYFYTSVPQMGAAASWGSLRPVNTASLDSRYYTAGSGAGINGYTNFPGGYPSTFPSAEVWLFTTPENPKSTSIPLTPLYRLSWKCGDYTPSPPAVCTSTPNHVDTTYTADPTGVAAYQSAGYKLDGIEGYIYPKTITQPLGTVRLMRKYNPQRDDHAIFPETALSAMTAQGYTQNSGSDWLGYVYRNTTGNVPVIY